MTCYVNVKQKNNTAYLYKGSALVVREHCSDKDHPDKYLQPGHRIGFTLDMDGERGERVQIYIELDGGQADVLLDALKEAPPPP